MDARRRFADKQAKNELEALREKRITLENRNRTKEAIKMEKQKIRTQKLKPLMNIVNMAGSLAERGMKPSQSYEQKGKRKKKKGKQSNTVRIVFKKQSNKSKKSSGGSNFDDINYEL